MGKIKKLLENELIGGTQSTDVYPVTSVKAVYDENNKSLDNIIKEIKDTIISTDKIANGAITKDKLSTDIQSLISNLSKNSLFAGIATPATNPSIPDSPVFYFANQGGRYTNFNNIVLSSGESVILKYNNGTWEKEIFPCTSSYPDSDPTLMEDAVIHVLTKDGNDIKPMTTFDAVFGAGGKSLTDVVDNIRSVSRGVVLFSDIDTCKESGLYMVKDHGIEYLTNATAVLEVFWDSMNHIIYQRLLVNCIDPNTGIANHNDTELPKVWIRRYNNKSLNDIGIPQGTWSAWELMGDSSTIIGTDSIEDGAVTDSKLATDIQTLISSLRKNATFAGIATPTTDPGTPDGPVFYIANQEGTYTNFNGIKLSLGDSSILKYSNGAWEKILFPALDSYNDSDPTNMDGALIYVLTYNGYAIKPMTSFDAVIGPNGKTLTEVLQSLPTSTSALDSYSDPSYVINNIKVSEFFNKKKYVAYGDSITQFTTDGGNNSPYTYPALIAAHFGFNLVNKGESSTTPTGSSNLSDTNLAAVDADTMLVTISGGANGWTTSEDIDTLDRETSVGAINYYIDQIRQISPKCVIVLCPTYNLHGSTDAVTDYQRIAQNKHVGLAPTRNLELINWEDDPEHVLRADGLHHTNYGSLRFAAVCIKYLEQMIL